MRSSGHKAYPFKFVMELPRQKHKNSHGRFLRKNEDIIQHSVQWFVQCEERWHQRGRVRTGRSCSLMCHHTRFCVHCDFPTWCLSRGDPPKRRCSFWFALHPRKGTLQKRTRTQCCTFVPSTCKRPAVSCSPLTIEAMRVFTKSREHSPHAFIAPLRFHP